MVKGIFLAYEGTIINSWKAKRPPAWDLAIVSQTPNKSSGGAYSPSVDNVEEWDWENIWLLGSGKVGNMSVERDTLGKSTSNTITRS